jgi:cation transport ATPase
MGPAVTYETAQLWDAITGLWDASDPAALQNQLRIYIWLFATGFTGTAAWRAKHRWMRLAMIVTNQAVQLAMMTTSFQKLVTVLEVPYESLAVLIGSILLSAWLFRFRKPRAYRDLERRRRQQEAEAAREGGPAGQDEPSGEDDRHIEPQLALRPEPAAAPATPGGLPPGQGRP